MTAAEVDYMMAEDADWRARTQQPVDQEKASTMREHAASGWPLARRYATDAIQLAEKLTDHPSGSLVVYRAHLVLGALAFREGDRSTALEHLHAAAAVPRSDALANSDFMSMENRLVDQLLKHGERQPVILYLERAAKLRDVERERLLKDTAAIRQGVMPELYQRRLALGHI